jgi:hypothetical protein
VAISWWLADSASAASLAGVRRGKPQPRAAACARTAAPQNSSFCRAAPQDSSPPSCKVARCRVVLCHPVSPRTIAVERDVVAGGVCGAQTPGPEGRGRKALCLLFSAGEVGQAHATAVLKSSDNRCTSPEVSHTCCSHTGAGEPRGKSLVRVYTSSEREQPPPPCLLVPPGPVRVGRVSALRLQDGTDADCQRIKLTKAER